MLQHVLEGIGIILVAVCSVHGHLSCHNTATNEISNSGSVVSELATFADREELANGNDRVEKVDDMSKGRQVHSMGERVKKRRLVRLKVIEINAEDFDADNVKDCLLGMTFDWKLVRCFKYNRWDESIITYFRHYRERFSRF